MRGIKDRVAVIGMGCSKFGERWDSSATDLIVEAAYEAYEDAGLEGKDIQAAWLGTVASFRTGQPLAHWPPAPDSPPAGSGPWDSWCHCDGSWTLSAPGSFSRLHKEYHIDGNSGWRPGQIGRAAALEG